VLYSCHGVINFALRAAEGRGQVVSSWFQIKFSSCYVLFYRFQLLSLLSIGPTVLLRVGHVTNVISHDRLQLLSGRLSHSSPSVMQSRPAAWVVFMGGLHAVPIGCPPISPNRYTFGLWIGLGPGFDYFRQYNVIRRIGIRRNGAEPPIGGDTRTVSHGRAPSASRIAQLPPSHPYATGSGKLLRLAVYETKPWIKSLRLQLSTHVTPCHSWSFYCDI